MSMKIPEPPKDGPKPLCLRLGCDHDEARALRKVIAETITRLHEIADLSRLDDLRSDIAELAHNLKDNRT